MPLTDDEASRIQSEAEARGEAARAKADADAAEEAEKNKSNGPSVTIWAVFVVAGLIALVTWVTFGQIPEGVLLGLLVFLVLGALFPIFAVAFGAAVLVYLFYAYGPKLFQFVSNLTKAQPVAGPAYTPIGPTVP